MTALNRNPQNQNYLQASKFILTFDRIPSVQFFCQEVNIPGISVGQALINSPVLDFYAPGNKITYNTLNINFAINEGAESWENLHAWFMAIASPVSIDERNRLTAIQNAQRNQSHLKLYSDATLTLLSNLNNPIRKIQFVNAFPISLSDITFDTKSSADDIITADASFVFEYHTFLPA
jgi:hypothetical protein